MRKTINIYTVEQMPEPDIKLLAKYYGHEITIIYYRGNDEWVDEKNDLVCKTTDISWWIDLDGLEASIELSLLKTYLKKG